MLRWNSTKYTHQHYGNEKNSQQNALQIELRMIIIALFFNGSSAEEEHDIAHIASSFLAHLLRGLFFAANRSD